MRNAFRLLAVAFALAILAAAPARAQTAPGWTYGYVPTVAQWNAAFANKQDYLGAPPLLITGGTMTGLLTTVAASTSGAGLNLPAGTAPTSPNNGDIWTTSAGLYVQINGATVGPLVGGSSGTFAATAPLAVSFPSSVVTYALNFNTSLVNSGGNLGINLAHSNTFTVAQAINLNAASLSAALTGSVLQLAGTDGVSPRIEVDGYGTGNTTGVPRYTCVRGDGTGASPTTLQSGDEICSINSYGYNGAGTQSGPAVAVRMYAAANWSSTSTGTYLRLSTTATSDATKTMTDRLSVENDGGIVTFNNGTAATGGSKGNGTLNLYGALYNNGTAPTGSGGGYVLATSPTMSGVTVTGSFTATGLVTNADLVNQSVTVNGTVCTLGSTCAPTATAASITVGTTSVNSGTSGRVLYDNAGTLGELAVTGSGSAVLATSPTMSGVTVTGSFTATGLVTNADLVSPSITIGGATCTLGSSCSPASALVVGSSTISSGSNGFILYNNAGTLGNLGTTGTGNVALQTSPTFTTPAIGAATGTSLALGGCTLGTNALCATGTATITSSAAAALAVGANGATNPVLQVNANTASVATGVQITGAAAGSGVAIAAISSGTNEALTIDAKGSGTITLGGTSTGAITLSRATTLSAALTYGGVTLSNSVTGTGSMVLSAGATLSGITTVSTLAATTINAFTLAGTIAGGGNNINNVNIGVSSPGTGAFTSLAWSTTLTGTSSNANAIAVGPNGATNPAFKVDASAATLAAGLSVAGAATGGTVAIAAIDSGSNTNLTLNAKGTGTIKLGTVSTGAVTIVPALNLGVSGSTAASLVLNNGTSGTITLAPATGALGSAAITVPAITDTLAGVALANGGTNNSLVASAGGIVWSDSTKLQILGGTSTSGQCLLSGNLAAPTWGSCSGAASVSSVSNSDSTLTISPTTGAVVASLNLGHANTWTAFQTISGAGLTINGTFSAAAWTTGGIRLVTTGGTITDTSSSGTVATAYTNVFGGETIAASSSTTYTNYISTWFKTPTQGTNVSGGFFGALGADNIRVGTSTSTWFQISGAGAVTVGGTATFNGTINHTSTFQINGNAMTFPGSAATLAALTVADQTLTGGANVTSLSQSTGSFTVDCGARPLQYITNNGAFTITAPSNDGSCIIAVTNGASASTVTFSGFSVGSSTGDTIDTTNGHIFFLNVARINGNSTYRWAALQ